MPKIAVVPPNKRFQWGPVPGVPYYLLLAAESLITGAHKRFGVGWPGGDIFFYGDQVIWYGTQSAVDKEGVLAARLIYQKGGRLKTIKRLYKNYVRQLARSRENFTPKYLKKLTTHQLTTSYKDFINLYQCFWHTAIQPEIIGYGLSTFLGKKIPLFFPENSPAILTTLSSASDYSFHQKEEIALLKILVRDPNNTQLLILHAQNYNWILNNYATGEPMTIAYFQKRSEELQAKGDPKVLLKDITNQFQAAQKKRKQIIRQLPAGEVRLFASAIGDAVAWHDDRKSWQLRSQTTMHYFLQEFSKRLGIHFDDLLYLTHKELCDVLGGRNTLLEEKVGIRKKLFAVHVTTKGSTHIYRQMAEKLFADYRASTRNEQNHLRGIVASKGETEKTTGSVRILRSAADIGLMQKGEILVAESTSPDYIIAIRKAKAIVTDAGGLTSHASVVSRELGIPCIVNTKHATSIFNDGDTIEINTVTGVVKLIEK